MTENEIPHKDQLTGMIPENGLGKIINCRIFSLTQESSSAGNFGKFSILF